MSKTLDPLVPCPKVILTHSNTKVIDWNRRSGRKARLIGNSVEIVTNKIYYKNYSSIITKKLGGTEGKNRFPTHFFSELPLYPKFPTHVFSELLGNQNVSYTLFLGVSIASDKVPTHFFSELPLHTRFPTHVFSESPLHQQGSHTLFLGVSEHGSSVV
jgi:hypothetical protein